MERLTNNPAVAYLVAYVTTHLEPLRKRSERGASAVEWAVITGIVVVAALAIGVAVKAKVTAGINQINSNEGTSAGVTTGTT